MKCHTPGCDREAMDVPGVLYCAPCRVTYLIGYQEGMGERASTGPNDPHLCPACGHFDHEGLPCGWHGGNCDEAVADPTLWCRCDEENPLGDRADVVRESMKDVAPRPKCWTRVSA